MKERYIDQVIDSHYPVRIIIPNDKRKKLIASELEKTMTSSVNVKGIIAANVSLNQNDLGILWYEMSRLKVKEFGDKAYNTGVYTSFDKIPSSLTPARKEYKEGTGPSRFDMIVYEQ
jgi:hypothetical protein